MLLVLLLLALNHSKSLMLNLILLQSYFIDFSEDILTSDPPRRGREYLRRVVYLA